MKIKLIKLLKIVSVILIAFYAIICAALYFNQDNLLFHPQPSTQAEVAEFLKANSSFDTITFVMKDGNRNFGFISKDTLHQQLPLVLYFGGNAEEVSHLADYKKYFPNSVMVLMNYRSFGLTRGKISEQTMFSDALEIYDKLVIHPQIDSKHVIIIGRSIGSGVATYVSSKRRTNATVLITPYDNMIDVAFEKYPYVPISLLINHRFESDKYASNITSPMLALVAKNDQVIPKHHAYALVKVWNGNTEVLEVDEDHSSIMKNEDVWKTVEAFVKENSK